MTEKQAKKNSLRRELFCITNTFTHSHTHTHGSKMIELRRRYVRVHVRTLSERTCRAEKGTGITYCTVHKKWMLPNIRNWYTSKNPSNNRSWRCVRNASYGRNQTLILGAIANRAVSKSSQSWLIKISFFREFAGNNFKNRYLVFVVTVFNK